MAYAEMGGSSPCCAPTPRLRLVTVSEEWREVPRRRSVPRPLFLGWLEVLYLLLLGASLVGSLASFEVMR